MCCHEHIYAIPQTWGLVCFILNIISPGFGTGIQSYYAKDGCSCSTYMVGVAQALTAVLIVGWVWAIWHGYEVMKVSDEAALGTGAQQVIVVNGGMMQQPMMVQDPNMMMQQPMMVQDPNMMQQQPMMVQDPNMMQQQPMMV